MTAGSIRAILFALFLLFSAFPAAPAYSAEIPDGDFQPHSHFRKPEKCPQCHVHFGSNLIPDRYVPGTDAFCLGCHSVEGMGLSHPLNIRPLDKGRAMTVPGEYRLDIDGRMICLSCHTAHGPFLSPVKAFEGQRPVNPDASRGTPRYYRTYFARRSDPVRGFAPLCEGCHGKR